MVVKNARGIDESGTTGLMNHLIKKAEELRGSPVLFELIQVTTTQQEQQQDTKNREIQHITTTTSNLFSLPLPSIPLPLLQLARDLLTENNRPHEDCPICLIAFEENEDFVKTPCFHYFHIDCFMSYCQTYVLLLFPSPFLPFSLFSPPFSLLQSLSSSIKLIIILKYSFFFADL